ncbi:MAG: SpoIIE family protein phosphatase [Salinibacterium sp.]|nr:SpoIIE family protein phosphatase [Salinibacterium sp.]
MAGRSKTSRGKTGSIGELHRPRRPQGSGIAMKFAVPVSLIVTVFMAGLGVVTYMSTRRALEESIDRAGTLAASALAAPDWAIKDNTDRLQGLLTESVAEVVIWEFGSDGNQVLVATATGSDKLPISKFAGSRNLGKALVERGRITQKDGEEVTYRSFRREISAPGGGSKKIAAVQVFLSEAAIERELASLLYSILGFCLVGIIAGVALCVMIAKSVTNPIHALIRDVGEVAKGNLKHRTHAHSKDEIGVLAESFDEMTRGLAEGMQAKADLTTKEHQEHIAQEIQEKLFPDTVPEISGYHSDAVFESGDEISSDLFDFVDLGEERTGLLLLSASGRGVPAAIILAMARSVFRAVTAESTTSPAATLRRINALFSKDLRRGMYVTAMYAIHDARTHQVTLASAGHKMPALHFQSEKGGLGRNHPNGIAMGLDKGPVFDKSLEESQIAMNPGDSLLLGTSGITELLLENGEALGEPRFFKTVLTVAKTGTASLASEVAAKLEPHLGPDSGEADTTLLSLHRRA